MSLSSLIRGKREPARFATATPATFATDERGMGGTVASIATVTVASLPKGQTASPAEAGADDTAPASRLWRLHNPDRDPLDVSVTPGATQAEMLARHPAVRPPFAPMTASEETAIRAWLALIEETDQAMIAEVIERCQRDAEARKYFTGRAAAELPMPDPGTDNRRACGQCANLTATGHCRAAQQGELLGTSPRYRPDPARLWRCVGYLPAAGEPDRRTADELWPGLREWLGQQHQARVAALEASAYLDQPRKGSK